MQTTKRNTAATRTSGLLGTRLGKSDRKDTQATPRQPEQWVHRSHPVRWPDGRPFSERLASIGIDFGIVAVLSVVVWEIGYWAGDFSGFPKGYDALGHLASIQLLISNWPHFMWNYAWYGGMPAYPGSYVPMYTVLVALGKSISGASISQSMDVATGVITIISVGSLYGVVRVLGRSRLTAIASSLVLAATPIVWRISLDLGEYPRLCAWAFANLATFLAAIYCRRPTKLRFAGTALVLSFALDSHPVVGVVGAVQVIAVLIAAPKLPYEVRLRQGGAFALTVSGLVAWFYLPYFLHQHLYYLQSPQFLAPAKAASFSLLFGNGRITLGGLPVVLGPMAVFAGILAGVLLLRPRSAHGMPHLATQGQRWRLRREAISQPLAASAAFMAVASACFVYAFIGYAIHIQFIPGIPPSDFLAYSAWPLAAAAGVALGGIVECIPFRIERIMTGAVIILIGIAGLVAVVPSLGLASNQVNGNTRDAQAIMKALPATYNQRQYRIAGTTNATTEWINAYTQTPQNRGHFAQGVLNPSYQSWMETVLDNPSATPAEIKFMADWYSIRWLYAAGGEGSGGSIQTDATDFTKIGAVINGPSYSTYEVNDPSPILSPTTSPTTLVVGASQNYQYVLQMMALAGSGSQQRIPIQGSAYIDNYTLPELEQYGSIVLYGFDAHSPAAAATLLNAYERHGGGVFVDVAGDVPLADEIAQANPSVFPVSAWSNEELDGSWAITANPDSPITNSTNYSQFSAPYYAGNKPWLAEFAGEANVTSKFLVRSFNGSVLIQGNNGPGTVIMSGMNLPYHAAIYQNATEATFFIGIIDAVDQTPPTPPATSPPTAINMSSADYASMTVPAGSTGVLFKEQDYPDWHATVNGRSAAIMPAGPGMMYVPVSSSGETAVVKISYQLSALENLSSLLTVATLVLLITYILSAPWLVLVRIVRYLLRKLHFIH